MQNQDQWSLRVSYLELKLLLEQATTQAVSRICTICSDVCVCVCERVGVCVCVCVCRL